MNHCKKKINKMLLQCHVNGIQNNQQFYEDDYNCLCINYVIESK